MAKKASSPLKLHKPDEKRNPQLYTLDVFIIGGPVTEKFVKKNPVISRTIQIRGDQTLEDLHHAMHTRPARTPTASWLSRNMRGGSRRNGTNFKVSTREGRATRTLPTRQD